MGKNIRINNSEPCLCGSGKKFKECCKSKIFLPSEIYSEDVLNNPQRINAILQKKMQDTDFKVCMYPNKNACKLPIKNAHTLQNNGVLSIIAENDHVMITDILNKVRNGSIIKRISKNKATTFYGFCEYHDSTLFKDIELREYSKTNKQNFLYAYRMIAQEYHKKQRVFTSLQNSVKDNPSILRHSFVVENYRMANLARADLKEYMDIFNNAYISQNFDILHTYVYEFSFQCQFAVTTMYIPVSRLNGEKIVDIYSQQKERLPSIFMTIFPCNNSKSYFIMSCLEEDYSKIKAYLDDVEKLNEMELIRFLNWTLPMYSENIILSPRLWDMWKTQAKKEYERMIAGIVGNFEKVLQQKAPFETMEDFFDAVQIQDGIINMEKEPKYNLFWGKR